MNTPIPGSFDRLYKDEKGLTLTLDIKKTCVPCGRERMCQLAPWEGFALAQRFRRGHGVEAMNNRHVNKYDTICKRCLSALVPVNQTELFTLPGEEARP